MVTSCIKVTSKCYHCTVQKIELKLAIEMHWTVLFLFGVIYSVAEASCPDEGPHHIFYQNNNVTAEPGNIAMY